MKLLEKLLEYYPEDYIKEKIDTNYFTNMKNDKKFVSLDIIAKNINLKNINYEVEDFLSDYPQYKKHKEIKTILNIQLDGEALGELGQKNKCFLLFSHTRNGFDFNSRDYVGKKDVLKYFDIDVDLSSFNTRTSKKCTDLIGKKEELEAFKKKYQIVYPVALEKENKIWHLTFDGMLNDWIKEIYLQNKKCLQQQ